MAKGDWPKSYVIPSLAMSAVAAGFLIWHVLDPAAKVDGWAITLLVVMFLPWLRTVFESIEFPGGGSVKWRNKVEAEQERQAADIEALRFLLARFISRPERELLQRFASNESIPVEGLDPAKRYAIDHHTDSLRRMGLISLKPNLVKLLKSGQNTSMDITTIEEFFDITDSGRQYLDLVAKLPAEIGQTYPDPSELRTGPSTPDF
jgi:hypothetical protein